MAAYDKPNTESEGVLASFSSLFYKVEVTDGRLVIFRRFPPATRELRYNEIASVKHERLVEYGNLLWAAVSIGLIYIFNFIAPARGLVDQLVLEAGNAMGLLSATAVDASVKAISSNVILFASMLLAIVAVYYAIKFAITSSQQLLIYRTGRKPLAFPLPLTGDALQVMAKINEKMKEFAGLSKADVEKLISDRLGGLLEQRQKMEQELIESLKVEVSQAKTAEDKARVKEKLQESITKLEDHDKMIDVELKKTGISRDELFKKYRIKAPRQEFLDSVLKDGGLEGLMND